MFLESLFTAGGEVTLAVCILLISILDMIFGVRTDKQGNLIGNKSLTYVLSLVAIAAAFIWLAVNGVTEKTLAFKTLYVSDHMAVVLKLGACLAAFFVALYSKRYMQERGIFQSEYYLLGLYALLGIFVLISGHNLLTIYLGLEMMALAQYGMIAFRRNNVQAAEAAMKYFVLGAIASGMLLYGMSVLYGMSGTLNIAELSSSISSQGSTLPLLFGMVFVVAGTAFKLGAVPFHMWLPDVYEGSPTAVTAFVASVPKFAAFALTYRVLVDGLGPMQADWSMILVGLAVLSLFIGNIVALAQTNVKRLLAYSTISHVGFILLGFIAGTSEGYEASLFYTLTYVLMAAAAFGLLVVMSRKLGKDGEESAATFAEINNLTDLNGLGKRNPWLAFLMLCVMFGMAGVPPFVGFWAKVAVITAVLDAGYLWLGILAVLFSVIGAFYYLRVVKHMYFDAPDESVAPFTATKGETLIVSINSLAILGLGLLPGAVWHLARVIG